jgi:hypothetical protein
MLTYCATTGGDFEVTHADCLAGTNQISFREGRRSKKGLGTGHGEAGLSLLVPHLVMLDQCLPSMRYKV